MKPTRVSEAHPEPHERYVVRRGDVTFTATPCYGMHVPWWVPRLASGKEADPFPFDGADEWVPVADRAELEAPPVETTVRAALESEWASAKAGHKLYRECPPCCGSLVAMDYGRMQAIQHVAEALGIEGFKMEPISAEEQALVDAAQAKWAAKEAPGDSLSRENADLKAERVSFAERLRLSQEHTEKLLAAIRSHRDQRGDDRCWQDDATLYGALPEGVGNADLRQCSPEVMAQNCLRFIAHRHDPSKPYVSPQRRIDELEAENALLRPALTNADHWQRAYENAMLHLRSLVVTTDGAAPATMHAADCATIVGYRLSKLQSRVEELEEALKTARAGFPQRSEKDFLRRLLSVLENVLGMLEPEDQALPEVTTLHNETKDYLERGVVLMMGLPVLTPEEQAARDAEQAEWEARSKMRRVNSTERAAAIALEARAKINAQPVPASPLDRLEDVAERDAHVVALALAELSLVRPGWETYLREVAQTFEFGLLFEQFRKSSANDPRVDEVRAKLAHRLMTQVQGYLEGAGDSELIWTHLCTLFEQAGFPVAAHKADG